MRSLAVWDNPACRALFPRALGAVQEFGALLRSTSLEQIREVQAAETLAWKLAFIQDELRARVAARRTLAADGGLP